MVFDKKGRPAYQHKMVTGGMLQHAPLKADLHDVFGIKPTKMNRPRLTLPKKVRTDVVYL